MKKYICMILLSLSTLSFAAPSVKDVEAEIKAGNYIGAESMLNQVIQEYPDSSKAFYYRSQIHDYNRDVAAANADRIKMREADRKQRFAAEKKKAESKKTMFNVFAGFALFCLTLLIVVALLIRRRQKIDAEELVEKKNKLYTDLLKQATCLNAELSEMMLTFKVHGYTQSTLYADLEDAQDHCRDLIEITLKRGDMNHASANTYIRDAQNILERADKYVRTLEKLNG